MQSIRTKATPLAILLACALVSIVTLAGCSSSTHEVIESTKACSACHGEAKETYDIVPQETQAVASTLVVSTSASEVYVCEPLFSREGDESFYVPRAVLKVSVEEGIATIQLEEGMWALVAGEDASAARVLITVSDDGAQEITL